MSRMISLKRVYTQFNIIAHLSTLILMAVVSLNLHLTAQEADGDDTLGQETLEEILKRESEPDQPSTTSRNTDKADTAPEVQAQLPVSKSDESPIKIQPRLPQKPDVSADTPSKPLSPRSELRKIGSLVV